MKPSNISSFEELVAYLRDFTNFGGSPAPYDYVAAFTLFSAVLANLTERHLDADLEDLKESGYTIDEAERRFLEKLLKPFESER